MESMCQLKNHHIQVHNTTTTKSFLYFLMAVVNSNYEFVVADTGVNSQISDRGILGNTEFGKVHIAFSH